MANTQHAEAMRLLPIIWSAAQQDRTLTYSSAAELLGRIPGSGHGRFMGSVCNLLDAAACLAGIPLLALRIVLDSEGRVNPAAWKHEPQQVRERIIARSRSHQFSEQDINAIMIALAKLKGKGSNAAWEEIYSLFEGKNIFHWLAGDYTHLGVDAINDLGSDDPQRDFVARWEYARDPAVRLAVLHRAKGKCEFCGKLGFLKANGTRYLETHHVIALSRDGADRLTNVIALCADDHREAHFGRRANELEEGMMGRLEELNRS